ncbi:MAG: DedA family protein [SAR86 cluster bacterium]|jgi:membrane protein DedA with SNARE-associated domain|uniref:DedA family protein n=1 Tax=SAR86 cluster bacterium TaxID=2030880 RepID=A0A520MTD9_9GAMM|nr:DedA family protein [Gammaproteobacteria bacterium]RZO24483.1 MAG: DedA family protein [SAR86 cluster bacterium]|tara:strand:+ start:686 stop:1189 length:504 start_codon:yes stop_codon:yes gene_type:complete
MFENIETFLSNNNELAWIAIFLFAFMESFILSGIIVSSAILFSVCIFVYNLELLPLHLIVMVAMLGAHIGDMSGFLFGKTLGPSLLSTKFMVKRERLIKRAQKFLDKTGSYTVILGRFVPAIRPIVPFLLGISGLKAVRFYVADVIACLCWGTALAFLVTGIGSILG